MTGDEILRRLRALHKIATYKRPYSFYLLARLSGIRADVLSWRMQKRKSMGENTRIRLERAFLLLENNQLEIKMFFRGSGQRNIITIKDEKKPVQSMAKRIRMTPAGPVVEFVPVNKLALPELPAINK